MEAVIQFGPWVIAIISAAVAIVTAKIQHKGRPENALIDQLQEQITSDRANNKQTTDDMKADIKELKAEQKAAKKREQVRDDYIRDLRKHIEDGNPPPPPPWPAGLYD